MAKIAGSGSESGSGSETGSISQRHESADPDPHQNVLDPEHCSSVKEPAEGGDVQPDHGGLPLRARPLPSLQVEGHPGHQVLCSSYLIVIF
jgi:hypothetical protein